MNHKKTIIALAVIVMAVASMSLVMSEGSDAGMVLEDGIHGDGFTNTADGTLFVPLKSTEDEPIIITITVMEGSSQVYKGTVTVPANESYTAELRFRLGSVGDHELRVICEPKDLFLPSDNPLNEQTVTVTTEESMWSKPVTYVAIIVVALLVVIAAFLKMRSAPATKPDTTFRDLEKQQKESRGEVVEEKPKAAATERKRYQAESPKAEPKPAAPPEEKKASTFTELDKKKTEKKDAAPKKESSSGEPKKLKYVSSRRK